MKITNKTTHWLLMCFFTLATLAFPLISVVGQTNLPCTPPPTGMVAWYPSDGNALDIQGANNGTLNNGATFTTTANGKVREAFSFDGNDDYVEIPDSAALNNTTATWSFWFKASQVSNDSGLLGKHNAPASLNGISIFLYNNKLGLQIKGSNTSQAVGLSSNTTITAGQFYHVSIAFQSGGTVQLYINGMLEATGTAPTFSFTSQPLRLGRQIDTYWSAFNGAIDEFSIFNRILQHHEIRAIYNSGANGKCKPCAAQPANIAAWYSGDDTAADMSGNGSSGTLQNGAGFAAGKAGQSFVFDGVDDYVSVPDSPNLNPTAQISLEAWVYPTSDTAGAGDVVMAIAGKDGFPFQYFISRRNSVACSVGGGIPTGNLAFYINGLSGLPGDCNGWVDGNAAVPLNAWSHVALTYDGTAVRTYVNGAVARTISASGTIPTGSGEFRIGARSGNDSARWAGQIDEVSLYNGALSATEIFNLYRAGSAGKCASCVAAPTGQVAFYTADGTSGDSVGTNEGTLQNGAFYEVGKVNEAFLFDGVDDFVEVPDTPVNSITGEIGIDAWVRPTIHGGPILSKYNSQTNQVSYILMFKTDGSVRFSITPSSNMNAYRAVDTIATVPLNAYTHVAATFNPATQEMKIYLNGADSPTTLVSGSTTVSEILDSTAPVRIGAVAGGGIIPFAGAIDEISLYNTALTPAQVQSIYNTGRGGKCKPALTTNELSVAVTNTPAAQNQNFTFTATVTNHGSMTANNVTLTANLPANLNFVSADAGCTFNSSSRRVTCIIGTIAAGFSDNEAINPTEQSSEFSPAASISKQIVVQQTTQGISQTNFTATADEADPVIANNLFAASVNVLAPTSASVFIGGRVTTADGRGIKNALITLVQANGNTRTVSSGASGNYRFADVAVGQTVMLQVTAKRFRFLPNTRFVNVMEDIDNADFSAQP